MSCVHVETSEYTPGMATCAKDVLDLTDSDVLLMAVSYIHGKKNPYRHVSVIGRAKPVKSVDLSALLREELGGNGHPKAASASFRMDQPLPNPTLMKMQEGHVDGILDHLVDRVVEEQIHRRRRRSDVMRRRPSVSAPPDITMAEVGEILETHDYRSCPVISHDGRLMGVVSITEVDVAAIKGQLDRPVSGYMKAIGGDSGHPRERVRAHPGGTGRGVHPRGGGVRGSEETVAHGGAGDARDNTPNTSTTEVGG